MQPKTLSELFSQICHKHTSKTAYLYRPKFRTLKWTYNDIWNHANSFANTLQQQGIQKGDNVILIGFNSPFWIAAFFGIQLIGAVAVPLSPESKSDFIKNIISQTKAKLIFKNHSILTTEVSIPVVSIEEIPRFNQNQTSSIILKEQDIAEIVYTSGTTGFPKGVVLTHHNLLSNLWDLQRAIPIDHTMGFVSILPLFHMLEQLGGMFLPFSAGAQVSYAISLDPNHLRKIFEDDKPDHMVVVPEFLRLVSLRLKDQIKKEGKSKIFKVMSKISCFLPMFLRRKLFKNVHQGFGWKMHTFASGGAPLEKEVGIFWENLGIYVLQGYGLTETSPILTVNRYQDRKVGSVGRSLRGVQIKLASDGEILAKGANVFPKYWKQEEKTKEAFDAEKWFKTGDIGFLDKDKHLYIKGRKKFIIVLPSGENVHPEDIEIELNKQEEVIDSTIIGLKKNGREEVHAVLLLKDNVKIKPIIDRVNKNLLSYQKIQSFSVWPHSDFPRTPIKKIKKHEVLSVVKSQIIDDKKQEGLISPVLSKLEKTISQIAEIGHQEISSKKKLVADLNFDSLKRIELVARIEKDFSVSLDESKITNQTTIKDLEVLISEKKHKHIHYPFNTKPFSFFTTTIRGFFQTIILNLTIFFFAPIKIKGASNIKHLKSPVLLFSNHLSSIDTAIIYKALPSRIRKKTSVATAIDVLYETKVSWIKYAKKFVEFLFFTFPFERNRQVKTSLEYIGRIIDRGFSTLVFPEGYISRTGEIQEFKLGTGLLGVEMDVPIIPIRLSGTEKVVPSGPRGASPIFQWPKRNNVSIIFGEPFSINKKMTYQEATRLIEKKIRNLK